MLQFCVGFTVLKVTSTPMPTFLKTDMCSTMVLPLACAFQKEKSRSALGCAGDEYATAIFGPYVQGGVPPLQWHPSSIPPMSRKLMEEVRHAVSIPMPG
jgi:hypothetical protein